MKYRRKQQLTIILVLVAVISTISVGFAAFSSTLNISSSATVTPNSSDFKVVLTHSYDYIPTYSNGCEVFGADYGGGANYSNPPCVTANSVSGLGGFFTAPNQYVEMTVYAVNKGKYDAYLKNINFNNVLGYSTNIVCTPETGATPELVEEACKGISIDIQVNNNIYYNTSALNNQKLEINDYDTIKLTIRYAENSARADGPFTVSIGDVSFDYSTIDNAAKTINFYMLHQIVEAEEGMTLDAWINSKYNTLGVKYDDNGTIVSKNCIKLTSVEMLEPEMIINKYTDIYERPSQSPNRNGTCS